MCLAIPSKIIEIDKETSMATVETMGVTRSANLALVEDEVTVGDWVLVHVGIAMSRIDENEARSSLDLYEEILGEDENGHDSPDGNHADG